VRDYIGDNWTAFYGGWKINKKKTKYAKTKKKRKNIKKGKKKCLIRSN
jgi:uncharacterized protein YcnI